MYIVTFYSFKGGVGRTLALANVGLELARTGRRVLLVDFDLEAPGIDTFELLRPQEAHVGLVDYVYDFTQARSAPDVRDYIHEATEVGDRGGRLWVMPAGKSDDEYSRRLNSINWRDLYDNLDGYLLFEDIKAQWKEAFKPDYVLVDSRTGHTDIGGICTRQLPDAVAIFFFPNEQNLAGLRPVVSSIRSEVEHTRSKPIHLHYVMSNVPDLDDEQEILAGLRERFRRELQYDKLACVIHRYESLSLLNQALFVVERPKSRLAKEYRELQMAITEPNIEDREAVVKVLTSHPRKLVGARTTELSEGRRIDEILKHYGHDGEVVYLLAMGLKGVGRHQESQMLLSKSVELGYRSPEALLARAEVRLPNKEQEVSQIQAEISEVLQREDLDYDNLIRAIEIARLTTPDRLRELVDAPAFRRLSGLASAMIAQELMWSTSGLEGALALLSQSSQNGGLTVSEQKSIRSGKSLPLIGLGRFTEAMSLFGRIRPDPQELGIEDSFNYGMAEWGETRVPPKDMFAQTISCFTQSRRSEKPNYPQCLAIAFWALGKFDEAVACIAQAESLILERPKPDFSCWRYMKVTPPAFGDDCAAIRALIRGENTLPFFMTRSECAG